jgi:phosphotransferase system enzyme I (PtsI)
MKGIGVSPGIAIGRAFVIKKSKATFTGIFLKNDAEIAAEIERFDAVVSIAVAEIEAIKVIVEPTATDEEMAILETQIEFLSDPQLKEDVIQKIN